MTPSSVNATIAPFERTWMRWLVRLAWVVGVLAVGAQMAEIPWRSALRGYDNTFNYLWLRSLMVDGDWDFTNDIEIANTLDADGREQARALPKTSTGRVPNKYGIGWAVVSAPGYLAADLVVLLGNAVGLWTVPRDGFGAAYQIGLHLWHVLLGIDGLLIACRILRQWFPGPRARLAVVIVWLASPLFYYQTSNVGMSHGVVFVAVVTMIYALLRACRTPALWWPWLIAGVALGLAVITRYQAGVFALIPAAVLAVQLRKDPWRGLAAAGWFTLGVVPWIALQLFAWKVVYGEWLVFSYGAENESFSWFKPALYGSLLSPWHGLFYWHPLLLVAFAGLAWWTFRPLPVSPSPSRLSPPAVAPLPASLPLRLSLLGVAVATMYVNAAWWCWWFAAAFGSRAFDGALFALMAGLAFLLHRLKESSRRIVLVACTALVAWNIYLFVLYRTATISRNEPVTWLEMLSAAPRLLSQLVFE